MKKHKRSTKHIIEWSPRQDEKIARGPPTKWIDDLKRIHTNSMEASEDWVWTSSGVKWAAENDDGDDDD